MKELSYTIDIHAPAKKLWNTLWQPDNYTEWTSVFQEGSYYKGEIAQGNEVLLLTPEGHGMFSKIEVCKPFEELTFMHQGEVMDGKKGEIIYENAFESYLIHQSPEGTTLEVKLNCEEAYVESMNQMFPKALKSVKSLAEKA